MRIALSIVFILQVLIFSSIAHSDTLHVPSEYATIQAAIDAAAEWNDTVLVAPGTYVENIVIAGKSVSVVSEEGSWMTVIDGGQPTNPERGSVVTFDGNLNHTPRLEGFQLSNGTGTLFGNETRGGGIYCFATCPELSKNFIVDNSADRGAGIYCRQSKVTITHTDISKNCAKNGGGVCLDLVSSCTISGTSISNNRVSKKGAGIAQFYDGELTISNVTISVNSAGGEGGGLYSECTLVLTDSHVTYNCSAENGGGIYTDGSLELADCKLYGNQSESDGGGVYSRGTIDLTENTIAFNQGEDGAGLYCEADFSSRIEDNHFWMNIASEDGGGMFLRDSFNSQAPSFSKNLFEENEADGSGGGACCRYLYTAGLPAVIENNRFLDNKSGDPGGGLDCFVSHSQKILQINGNLFKGNSSSSSGGGLRASGSSSEAIQLTDNRIEGNTASSGGGVQLYGPAEMRNNCIIGNATRSSSGVSSTGGGVAADDLWAYNCIIADNFAESSGGGLYVYSSFTAEIVNCTIVNNESGTRQGGGVHSMESEITNSIIWHNRAAMGGAQIYGSNNTVSYSNVEGGWTGVGNIDAEPRFVDMANQDFHLLYTSPCRGAGDASHPGLPEFDFEGDPRIAGSSVDMGADEFHTHFYCMGDFTPGGLCQAKFIGEPGSAPNGLLFGSGLLDPPMQSPWGELFLDGPLTMVSMGSIPTEGVLVLSTRIPSSPSVAYDVFMQGLVGMSLTNPFVMNVK